MRVGGVDSGLLFCIEKHLAGKLFVISGKWQYVFLYHVAYSSVIFILHDVKCKLTFQFWEIHWRQEEVTARPLSGMASDGRDQVSYWFDLVTPSLCLQRKLRPFKHLKQNFTPEIKVWQDLKSLIFFKSLENEIVVHCNLVPCPWDVSACTLLIWETISWNTFFGKKMTGNRQQGNISKFPRHEDNKGLAEAQ